MNAIQDGLKNSRRYLDQLLSQYGQIYGNEFSKQQYQNDIKALIRVCIGNSIFVQGLVNEGEMEKAQVVLDWKYHAYFPVLCRKK